MQGERNKVYFNCRAATYLLQKYCPFAFRATFQSITLNNFITFSVAIGLPHFVECWKHKVLQPLVPRVRFKVCDEYCIFNTCWLQIVELCVKYLLQKAVHAPCSLCWLHKWGGLQAQLLHIAPGNARGSDVALIKVSRSVRAACIMRGNAPLGVKGINGLRAFGAWHFCAGEKMPNVSIAVYVPPGRCPGLWATFGLTARPNHLPCSPFTNVHFIEQKCAIHWTKMFNVFFAISE